MESSLNVFFPLPLAAFADKAVAHLQSLGLNRKFFDLAAYCEERLKLELVAFASHLVDPTAEVKVHLLPQAAETSLSNYFQTIAQIADDGDLLVFLQPWAPRVLLSALPSPPPSRPLRLCAGVASEGGSAPTYGKEPAPAFAWYLNKKTFAKISADPTLTAEEWLAPHDFFNLRIENQKRDWLREKILLHAQGQHPLLPFLLQALFESARFACEDPDLTNHPFVAFLRRETFFSSLPGSAQHADIAIVRSAKNSTTSLGTIHGGPDGVSHWTVGVKDEILHVRGFPDANFVQIFPRLEEYHQLLRSLQTHPTEKIGFGQQPALILDRDGTLIEHIHYLADPQQVRLISAIVELIRQANRCGWVTILLTNQSGLGRGLISVNQWEAVQSQMLTLLSRAGVHIDLCFSASVFREAKTSLGFLNPTWRKPGVGALNLASSLFRIDFTRSIVAGDSLVDMELAHNLGVKHKLLVGHKSDQTYPEGITELGDLSAFSPSNYIPG